MRRLRGRRGRIFRNFLLAGVLGALIWACAGWPVPARWELRRLEREILLSPHSQFQGSIQDSWGDEVLIGLTPRWLVMGSPEEFRLWPREGDGPVLAPVPEEFTLRGGIRVVAAGAPQGTASAQLTLEVSHWYENIMLLALVALFFMDGTWVGFAVGLVVAVLAYLLEVYIDNGFARMKWQTALKSGWVVALVLGVGNVIVLLLM